MEGDARNETGSSVVSMESLVYNDLMEKIEEAGIFWPNPAQDTDSGQHTSQKSDATDELVFSLFPHTAILNNCFRNWDYGFYDSFLNQISDLASRSPT